MDWDEDDGVRPAAAPISSPHTNDDVSMIDTPSLVAPPSATNRYAVLADLSLSFQDAFVQWLSKQGSEVILREESYTVICDVLKRRDVAHARYKKWSEKYELIDLDDGAAPYLQVRVNAADRPKPRGKSAQVGAKRKIQEVQSVSTSSSSTSNSSVLSSPPPPPAAAPTPIVWTVKRVPRPSQIEAVIAAAHSSSAQGTGHGGIRSTFHKVDQAWINIPRSLIEAYIKRCRVCSLSKPVTSTKYEIQAVQSNHFWHRVQMDEFVLKEVIAGEEQIHIVLHIQDHFSKFSLLFSVADKTAKSVADIFFNVLTTFGPMEILQTDNGTEFKNQLLIDMSQEWGFKMIHGAPYKPQTQGSVERGNGLAKDKLRASLHEQPNRPFEHHLAMTQWHLNTTFRRSIGMTPYQLVYGRPPRAMPPSQHILPPTTQQLAEPTIAVVEARVTQQSVLQAAAAVSSTTYQEQFVAQYNGQVGVNRAFQPGDLVGLRLHNPRNHKGIPPASLALPRFPCVIIYKNKVNKFVLLCKYGIITERIATTDLELMAEIHRPPELQVDHVQVYQNHVSNPANTKTITLAELIERNSGKAPIVVVDKKKMTLRINKNVL